MKLILTLIQLLFIVYYAYVCFVFYKLYENSCECEKLETFKKTWNFHYISVVSPLLLLFALYHFKKLCCDKQFGGKNESLYYQTLIMISLGYAVTFFNDYAILNLFDTMENKNCPCQRKNREHLTKATYVKLGMNILFYIHFMVVLDKKKFDTLLRKINKTSKRRS